MNFIIRKGYWESPTRGVGGRWGRWGSGGVIGGRWEVVGSGVEEVTPKAFTCPQYSQNSVIEMMPSSSESISTRHSSRGPNPGSSGREGLGELLYSQRARAVLIKQHERLLELRINGSAARCLVGGVRVRVR